MTKREAIAWLEKHHACDPATDRARKCASVKQMIAKAYSRDLVWVIYEIGGKVCDRYSRERELFLDLPWAKYDRKRVVIARRILLEWASK